MHALKINNFSTTTATTMYRCLLHKTFFSSHAYHRNKIYTVRSFDSRPPRARALRGEQQAQTNRLQAIFVNEKNFCFITQKYLAVFIEAI